VTSINQKSLGLTTTEWRLFKKLNTPVKIQDYLDTLKLNFEEQGDTYMSPRRVLKERKAHCLEGAVLAAAAFLINGQPPLLLDLHANLRAGDYDHVVAPFKVGKYWGAISKTNHAVLRYREPVYRDIRELAMSYFHEYFLHDGKKTLISYSTRPLDLRKFMHEEWLTTPDDMWFIQDELDKLPHQDIVPKTYRRKLRRADKIERKVGKIMEWRKRGL
jgi:hypothetical protein